MKQIEHDTNKQKYTLCSWIGRVNIVQLDTVSKAIYRFNTNPVKIVMLIFTELK